MKDQDPKKSRVNEADWSYFQSLLDDVIQRAASDGLMMEGSRGFVRNLGMKRQALSRGVGVACGCERAFSGHNHTYFSVLDGISSPDDMVSTSAKRGWQGFGITDHGSMGGNLKAGAAAKKWKTARLSDGSLVNFEEVQFAAGKASPLAVLFKGRELRKSGWASFTEDEKKVLSGGVVFDEDIAEPMVLVAAEPGLERLVVGDSSVQSKKIPLSSLPDNHGFIVDGRVAKIDMSLHDVLSGVKGRQAKISYNPRSTSECVILNPDDIQSVMPFTVVSGVELYISWEKDKDKRYNHITCYATGMKGHETLVLLTSLGSISSRRYVGERGFFRPRIFVEDLSLALAQADGELVITTGCPASITSEALRRGDMASAEAFFEWAIDHVPKGRFFAELHLCDVSMDYNRLHPKADGKFFAEVMGVPVSRMRFTSENEALNHALSLQSDLARIGRAFGGISNTYGEDVSFTDRIYESDVFKSKDEETKDFVNSFVTTGVEKYFKKLDIDLPPPSAVQIDEAKTIIQKAKKILEETLDAVVAADEPGKKTKKKTKKNAVVVDEDTAALIDHLLKTLSSQGKGSVQKAGIGAYFVAAVVSVILARVIAGENVKILNPTVVVTNILRSMSEKSPSKHAQSIQVLSDDRVCFLDLALSGKDEIQAMMDEAAAAMIELLHAQGIDSTIASPNAGPEDLIEREFVKGKSGNWMVQVNRGLVVLAEKYDVPLMIASDAHMASIEIKPVQDALLKNGERRRWHFSRPYAIAPSSIPLFCEEAGRDYSGDIDCAVKTDQNIVRDMIDQKAITMDHIVESFGAGSLLLDEASCVSTFKWEPAPPRIAYKKHPLYSEAREWLDSGALREFLPAAGSGAEFEFGEGSVNIATALLVVLFFRAIDRGDVPNTDEYLRRILSELYLQQEVPPQQLADFFLVLQYSLKRFRDGGVSVGPGRGSSGGMLTAYISGITFADPIKHKFLESRWMNRGRKEKGDADADIDIDVDNRQIAGYIFAQVAKEAIEDEMESTPLSPLEAILLPEIFYSSPSMSHGEVTDRLEDSKQEKGGTDDLYSVENLSYNKDDPVIFGSPIIRVGTYQSLKAKAAVKEAIRMMDATPFEKLPSFGIPTSDWLSQNKDRIRGLSEEERNGLFEEETFGYLSMRDRTDRRRVRLAERISEEMKIGSGMTRLYQGDQMELDFFMGSVYSVCPEYWDHTFPPPSGSVMASRYFDQNPTVKEMALRFLNIYKNVSVHAGGFCIGREVMTRIPLRVDKHGFVSQFEMKDLEKVRVLKFDILGLNTLTLIKESLRMWVDEQTDEDALKIFPADVWHAVKLGESTDYLWKYLPLSTPEAVDVMCKNRSTIFQIDTKVFGKELDRLDPQAINSVVSGIGGDQRSSTNMGLVDILSAFLALFRPGPMKSQSHSLYLDRLLGSSYKVDYEWMTPYVKDTFGVIAYQEQVMSMVAGAMMIDPAAAIIDEVRRAMGKKQIAALKKMRAQELFEDGLAKQGVPRESAKAIWAKIEPFAEYGFNLPHSYHYGVISAMTLWSKAHNFRNWFKTTMANSKPEEVARFLGEITNPRAVCVLRSDEFHWSYVGKHCYQGISNIAGLQEKDIAKITAAKKSAIEMTEKRQEKTNPSQVDLKTVSPVDFFHALGSVSQSLAEKLAKSGSLRIFGDRETIARAYGACAVVRKEDEKSLKREIKANAKKALQADDKDSLLNELLPVETHAEDQEKKTARIDTSLMASELFEGLSREELKQLLNKDDRETVDIFARYGYNILWPHGNQAGRYKPMDGILSPESALDMISMNKTKGLGVRWYVFSMTEQSAREGLDLDIVTLGEIVKFSKTNGEKIRKGGEYFAPAFVGGIFSGKNFRTGQSEYRVNLIADGNNISAKFDKSWAPDQVEEVAKLLKDEKMQTMLLFSIVPNSFRDRQSNRDISYYTITGVTRPKSKAAEIARDSEEEPSNDE